MRNAKTLQFVTFESRPGTVAADDCDSLKTCRSTFGDEPGTCGHTSEDFQESRNLGGCTTGWRRPGSAHDSETRTGDKVPATECLESVGE
ncbi:hypothetical protein BH10PLA2_BH10PLA2_06340 [soil metagenome]